MIIAPIPPNEKERLAALERYNVLDTLPEQEYDDLTFLAATICEVPISLITFVERDRQWFKSTLGLDARETPRSQSFCAHAILSDDLFVVPDTHLDARFQGHPAVLNDPKVRFYAGAPLKTSDGFNLGTLCVVDRSPRKLSPRQRRALEALARQVMAQLELHRTVERLQIAEAAMQNTLAHLASNAAILRQFVQYAPAAIAMLDTELRYIAVSHRFLSDYDLDSREILGRRHLEIFPDLPQSWLEAYEKALGGEVTQCLCDELRRKSGETAFVQWQVRPWKRESGALGGIITLTEDITARVQSERLKNEFVSVVSHELRTPLTSIKGSLGLLQGGIAGQLSERGREMVEIALKNAERLVVLINDILDVEKIESGQMHFEMAPLDVAAFLGAALESNAPYAASLGVRLEMAAPVPPLQIVADDARLMQVMANLLSNAAKFTPSGGVVRVRAAQIGGENDSQWVRVEVEDGGPGVPEAFLPRLFQRFAQADSSATRQRGGTGLGLAIARVIVEKHGGFIGYRRPQTANSREDEANASGEGEPLAGSVFYFDLPLHFSLRDEDSSKS